MFSESVLFPILVHFRGGHRGADHQILGAEF